jgi:F0F1-type ATP synthase assembly protein I
MKRINLIAGFLLIVMAPLVSMAHPGHGGSDGYTIIHYFIEPVHAIVTLGIIATTFAVVRFANKKAAQKQK